MKTQNLSDTRLPETPHIVVVGAGAMGCIFGGKLSQAGNRVTLIDVNPEQIKIMNERGLMLEMDHGTISVPATAALATQVKEVADILILFTKTLHTEAALNSVQHLIGESTIVVSLQNGLGNAEKISRYVPQERIVIGTTLVPADLKGPGHVASHGPSSSQFMDVELKHPRWLDDLVELFNQAELNVSLNDSIMSVIWSKVAFNAALNAICAGTGATPGVLDGDKAFQALAHDVVHEAVIIGQLSGVELDEAKIWGNVQMAIAEHANHKPSMLQDIEAGRKTEIAAINGAIVTAAEKVGSEAPVNRTLTYIVQLKEHLNGQ